MAENIVKSRVLNPGEAAAPAMVLDDPLSFWGGFDPLSGEIIDQHHPQAGQRVGGHALVIPSSRGSAGTPAGIAESIRLGVGPAAIILGREDINIAVGASVAARLYSIHVPVVVVEKNDFSILRDGDTIEVLRDGTLRL